MMKNHKKQTQPPTVRSAAAEYLTYIASVGNEPQNVEIRYEDENIWLTQRMMALLYDVETNTINYHIKKIFEDSELQEEATIRNFRIVQSEGGRSIEREVKHYNLQMIIAVGFKVNSERAVQFRKWVNGIASTYTIKGWVMDDERLKRGTFLTDKYFDEQLERIREIRASERKFYQKITDLYATAIDYDRTALATKRFYATVQNKMHFAVHSYRSGIDCFTCQCRQDSYGLDNMAGCSGRQDTEVGCRNRQKLSHRTGTGATEPDGSRLSGLR